MKIKCIILLFAVSALLTVAHAQKGDWATLYEASTYKDLPYRLMKPLNFDKSKKYPLILSLHGAGGKGKDNSKQLKDWNGQLADEKMRKAYPAYVLAPQSTELWHKAQFLIIKEIIAKTPAVDMNRIYILGHSMGGHGTFIFIQIEPEYFAAAAPSAGTGLRRTEAFINAEKIKDIPIWTFHGDKDGVCPYAKVRKLFDELKALNGNMKLTSWKGDKHGVSGKFIPGAENGTTELSSDRCSKETDFMTWLFSQKKK